MDVTMDIGDLFVIPNVEKDALEVNVTEQLGNVSRDVHTITIMDCVMKDAVKTVLTM